MKGGSQSTNGRLNEHEFMLKKVFDEVTNLKIKQKEKKSDNPEHTLTEHTLMTWVLKEKHFTDKQIESFRQKERKVKRE